MAINLDKDNTKKENKQSAEASVTNYEKESAADFFAEIEHALSLIPDYRRAYRHLNKTFRKCLNQSTSDVKISLVGTFAKTDYLLKENNADKVMVRHTNNLRVRLRKQAELSDAELEKWCYYDIRNLSQFIAFIFNAEVPESLVAVFPAEEEELNVPTLLGDSIRLIVNSWDNDFIYGTAEDSDATNSIKVCYSHGNKAYDFDWTYIHDFLYTGAQLNVVRPRESKGIVYPELIIFEPDYLVDISTVARCFTSYADSALVNLIKKLEPSPTTQPITLGNFAGQLLDEQIHQMPENHTYSDSIKKFWQGNAISLLTANIDKQFHVDAKDQKANIAKAIGSDLPADVSSFDPKECIVEPSFFSEMLGLQGRMDFLQLDYKILVEQKSGKWDEYHTIRQREEHYVQLLLYMLLIRYNFSEIYKQNGNQLFSFLLYSKYPDGLLSLGFAPELVFRAIKVRNEIAWIETQLLSQEGGFKILETLTPDKLNLKNANNKLWISYQSKQINDVLSPIHNASDLERAYYFRFLTFLANEHLLSKIGNRTKESSGFASNWHDTLEEKLQAGNIYDNLTLIDPTKATEGNIEKVKLQFSETENNDMSNFRVGDIVILYPYDKGKEPDVRRTMVFRCTIESIDTDTIVLVLRAAQSDARVFLKDCDRPWAIEHDFMEASFSSLYRGMQAFLSAPKERRDLLLLQRSPKIDSAKKINGEYGPFNELATRVKRADDLFLIIGPPGTGKTSHGLMSILKEELTEPDSSVLLLSYTNRAVDEICSKLQSAGIDFIRIGSEASCSAEYRDNLLSVKSRQCKNLTELTQLIKSTRVFVATTSSMNTQISLLKLKQFDLAIVDEASQILEPHLIGILSAHNNDVAAIKKVVLIGDHKQLPAVVQQEPEVSKVNDVALNAIHLRDCRQSLFERLLNKYRNDPDVVYMLTKQGRMHRDIASFANYAFYNNLLDVVPLTHQQIDLPHVGSSDNGIDNILSTRRLVFLHADLPEASASDKVNQVEADIIAATVLRIYDIEKDNFDPDETIGIIVPYRNQIATVRNTIDRSGIKPLHDITIDTVERFQGSQRKYIVYGFTVQKRYQLKFLTNNVFTDMDGCIIDRKLNVALTRAKEHLIIVGNTNILSNNSIFRQLIDFVRDRQGYFSIPISRYLTGNFEVPPYAPQSDQGTED